MTEVSVNFISIKQLNILIFYFQSYTPNIINKKFSEYRCLLLLFTKTIKWMKFGTEIDNSLD